MKETLRSKCLRDVEPFLTNGVVPAHEFRNVISKIVEEVVDNQTNNRVLNARPPLIHPEEKALPRVTRATLSRLRPGHCFQLQSYRCRVERVIVIRLC